MIRQLINLLSGGVPSWILNPGTTPAIDAYLAQGLYYGTSLSAINCSRSSSGTASDTAGNWSSFAAGVPRLTNQGLLVEEGRTNQIRNNTMVGAVGLDSPTLVTNGTFTLNPLASSQNSIQNGWGWVLNSGNGTVVWDGISSLSLTGDGSLAAAAYTSISVVSGMSYTITVTAAQNGGQVEVGTVPAGTTVLSPTAVLVGSNKILFTATSTGTVYITFFRQAASTFQISNVSVKTSGSDQILTNYSFDQGSTGWTTGNLTGGQGTISFSSGQVSITGDGTNIAYAAQSFSTTVGSLYAVTVDVASSNGVLAIGNSLAGTGLYSGTVSGTQTVTFVATATTTYVTLEKAGTTPFVVNYIAVVPSLVTNGTFTSNPVSGSQNTIQAGWEYTLNGGTGTVVYAAGSPNTVTLTGDGTHGPSFSTSMTTVQGVTYTITADLTVNAPFVQVGTAAYGATILNTTPSTGAGVQLQFTATGTTSWLTFTAKASAASPTTIANVRVTSAGSLPTNWTAPTSTGLIYTVLGVVTDSGLPSLDYGVTGTPTATTGSAYRLLGFDAVTQIAAAYGQTWVQSHFNSLVGGSFTGLTNLQMRTGMIDSGGLNQGNINLVSLTTATSGPLGTQRVSSVAPVSYASTAYVFPWIAFGLTQGTPVNFVLRLAAQQLEYVSTQTVTNPSGNGVVAGSPGTLPTNWSTIDISNGFARTLSAQTTLNGVTVVPFSYTTPSTTIGSELDVQPAGSTSTQYATSAGQTINASVYYQTTTDNSFITAITVELVFLNSSGAEIGGTRASNNFYATRTTAGRYVISGTAPTGAAFALLRVRHAYTAGTMTGSYAFQIGGWTWEATANSFASSPILTSGSAQARAADVVTLTNPPAFGSAYTLFGQGVPLSPSAYSNVRIIASIDDGTVANRLRMGQVGVGANPFDDIVIGNSGQSSPSVSGFWTQGSSGKMALSATAGFAAGVLNGGTVATTTPAGVPSVNTVHIGVNASGINLFWNGYVSRIAIWPKTALSSAALQSITT